jgi:hypothetical protein
MTLAPQIVSRDECNRILVEGHYLGPTTLAQFGWRDEHGVMLFAKPRSRHLPADWIELVRWCLNGKANAGSRQWRMFVAWARQNLAATTVISYSDPSQGHTGSLYRACNWQWAPTWHRLRPPPSQNGSWSQIQQAVKDRWIFPLRVDARRQDILKINDEAVMQRMPWASYPGNYKRWREAFSLTSNIGGE